MNYEIAQKNLKIGDSLWLHFNKGHKNNRLMLLWEI